MTALLALLVALAPPAARIRKAPGPREFARPVAQDQPVPGLRLDPRSVELRLERSATAEDMARVAALGVRVGLAAGPWMLTDGEVALLRGLKEPAVWLSPALGKVHVEQLRRAGPLRARLRIGPGVGAGHAIWDRLQQIGALRVSLEIDSGPVSEPYGYEILGRLRALKNAEVISADSGLLQAIGPGGPARVYQLPDAESDRGQPAPPEKWALELWAPAGRVDPVLAARIAAASGSSVRIVAAGGLDAPAVERVLAAAPVDQLTVVGAALDDALLATLAELLERPARRAP